MLYKGSWAISRGGGGGICRWKRLVVGGVSECVGYQVYGEGGWRWGHYELHCGVELGMNGTWWQDVGGVVRGDSEWNGGGGLGMIRHNRRVLLGSHGHVSTC